MNFYRCFIVSLVVFSIMVIAGFLFGQGMKIGQHLKLEQEILKDDYRSLNHRLNNLEQNYDRVIRLYTLGREEEKGE